VIIDETGMADTLSLDPAVQFVIARGGSVRLVGDDQHLAAIGAGGLLLDAIMIAPTRNLVAQLNARARAHRLNHSSAASEVSWPTETGPLSMM
jgi:hypothetical protein